MPISVTPKPTYPNVPQAPGVPPLLRQIGQIQSTVVLAVADAAIVLSKLGLFGGPQWGLFTQAGAPAFAAASSGIAAVITNLLQGGSGLSVGDVEFRLDHRIATAPQEQGAFSSYNKVSTPFAGRVTYIVSGTEAQRGQFLAQVLAMEKSLTLLTLVMPEYSYPSCNVTHHDFRRTARKGVTMIEVDVWVEEVRVTGTAQFSNTAAPSGAAPVDGGTVQPQASTPAQTTSLPAGPPTAATGGGTGPVPGPAAPDATGTPGGAAGTNVGVPSQPYFDDDGKQIGIAPSTTPASGVSVGNYANGQPVIGGDWQKGFYDQNNNWVHP